MTGGEWAATLLVVGLLLLLLGLGYLVRLEHELQEERDGSRAYDELEGEDRIERARRQIGARELEEWQEQIREGHR